MKLRKILGVAAATILCLASSITALGAGLSASEQALLDQLKAGFTVNGVLIEVPASVINQVENELMKNDVDVTAKQADVILAKLDEAVALAEELNVTSIEDVKAKANKFLPIAKEAAKVVNYTIAYDAAKGIVTVANPNGNTVFATKNVINQTGFDLTTTVVAGGVVVTLLAACFVVASKKKLFVKAVEA